MIFQPAILALLLASAANLVMLLAAAPFALAVIRDWDIGSGSERQLKLERKTYLIAALLAFLLTVQLASLLLFVFNADRMAPLFTGAMCAVGSLNANEYGFPALLTQMAVFFLAAMWLAVNHVDTRAPDYPLVRVKYALLLGLAPMLAAAFVLELNYFLNLRADVITSCCARSFSAEGPGLSSELASLKPAPARFVFFGGLSAAVLAALYTAWKGRLGYVLGGLSAAAFAAALAGIVSFLSLYVYEHPNHHCPFCVLKAEYGYQGYALYVPLFAATACGLAAGAVQPFAGVPSLRRVIPRFQRRLGAVAAAGYAVVLAAAGVILFRSHLIL